MLRRRSSSPPPYARRAPPRAGSGVRTRWRSCTRLWCFAGLLLVTNVYFWRDFLFGAEGPFARWEAGWAKDGGVLRPAVPPKPIVSFGTMGTAHRVREYGVGASGLNNTDAENAELQLKSFITPPQWDSRLCLEHWGREELLTEVDPNGYVVFVSGAEQLGGNKYLLADGLFIAKILGRTLVEYPAKDARISVANATLGLGAYWDLSAMCMNHRILDLRSFRGLVERGLIRPDDFVTIETSQQQEVTRQFKRAENVHKFYKDKKRYKVIVMEHTWKSRLHRRTMSYLHPNPFYYGVVRMLLMEHEDFKNGNFLAVQWRTETATGDMVECYEEVRTLIDKQLDELGLTRYQVIVSTDMYGNTSGTYGEKAKQRIGAETIRRIKSDYPKALDNRLHDFFNRIQDTGVKAIVSGLVIAQARVLLASSLNDPASKSSPEAAVCQKPYSGYIQLISDWREELFRKQPESVVRLFPFGDGFHHPTGTSTDSETIPEPDAEDEMGEVEEDEEEGGKTGGGAKGGGDKKGAADKDGGAGKKVNAGKKDAGRNTASAAKKGWSAAGETVATTGKHRQLGGAEEGSRASSRAGAAGVVAAMFPGEVVASSQVDAQRR